MHVQKVRVRFAAVVRVERLVKVRSVRKSIVAVGVVEGLVLGGGLRVG
jgi:hypothetical protein